MKICIMGTPVKSGNRGVLALGASLINLCAEARPESEISLLLINRDNHPVGFRVGGEPRMIPVVNARMSPRSRLRDHLFCICLLSILYRLVPIDRFRAAIALRSPWVKAVREADFVGDVRGGDSFSDIYGMSRFLQGFLTAWSVLLIKRRMIQFPQTYGPYKSRLARWMARFLVRRSTVIARDEKSRAVALSLARRDQQVGLSPDVAFSLEVVVPPEILTDPPWTGAVPSGVIGLNVNGLMYHGGYTGDNMFGLKLDYPSFLKKLVPALLQEFDGELWLIPHTYAPPGDRESDLDACRALREALGAECLQRVRIVAGEYDQHEIKGIIGQCNFFVGSRMHACIGALSQGIPCVGVAYSMKFGGVFQSVGMEDWVIDGRTADDNEAVAGIVTLYRRKAGVKADLGRRAAQARSELTGVFRQILSPAG